MKKTKGITLIVLIITIIVMLILVGVVIDITIDGSLFDKAQTAVDSTNDKIAQTQNRVDDLMGRLNNVGETTGEDQSEFGPGKRASKNEEYTIGDKTAIIPEGFTLSGYTGGISTLGGDETTIEGGLVIYDIPANAETIDWTNEDDVNRARTTYNQFVWIPVEFTKAEGETYETANKNFDTVWVRSAWSNNARTTGLSTDYTEPYSYDTTNNFDSDSKTGIAAELESMRASVYKYGGFYIARYEAGYVNSEGENTPRTSSSMPATLPVFRQDAYPYDYVAWGDPSKSTSADNYSMGDVGEVGAVYLSRNIELKSGSTKVTSMLCSSVAWDAMMDFVKDTNNVSNSTDWGNYNNASFTVERQAAINWKQSNLTQNNGTYTKAASSNVLLTTGASEKNKSKNIYDVAGNCWEWTTEAYSFHSRVLRGRLLWQQWL